MDYIYIVLFFIALYIPICLYGLYENKKRKNRFLNRLKNEYGAVLRKEYSAERLNALTGFYKFHCDNENNIDDVTWNDIAGDDLFKRINYCYSSSGEEYLYYRLRTLRFNVPEDEKTELEERLSYIDLHDDERIQMQYAFAKLGRTGKYSIFQYVKWLDAVKEKPLWSFWLKWILYIAVIVLFFINVPVAVVALIVVIMFFLVTYFKAKREIEPYLISFAYLLRTFEFVKDISKNKAIRTLWGKEIDDLISLRKKIKIVSRFRMSMLTKDSGGDPISEALKMYLVSMTHFDLFYFYGMLKQVKANSDTIDEIITILGRMESEISIASFRRSLNFYSVPEFCDENFMRVNEAFHPLVSEPVANSFHISRGMLLTGSNASGKSTFLKAVEICAILAQTIQTVPAKEYCAREYRVYSSMALRDNLSEGESYYIVEIKAIKRILEAAQQSEEPVLCFVDEVLRGTNTVERISAASEIMRYLVGENVLCFAATHDVELTGILDEYYDNYHFEEEISNDDISFPYRLMKGPAKSRNAIKLLKMMKYPKELTDCAEKRALKLLEEKVARNGA